jgi:hypothetical protein
MISGKALRQVLDKFMKSPAAQEARVQVLLPDGKYYDITSLNYWEQERHIDLSSQSKQKHGIWDGF